MQTISVPSFPASFSCHKMILPSEKLNTILQVANTQRKNIEKEEQTNVSALKQNKIKKNLTNL